MAHPVSKTSPVVLGASPESSGQKRTARGKNCSAVERHSRVTGRLEVSHVEGGRLGRTASTITWQREGIWKEEERVGG